MSPWPPATSLQHPVSLRLRLSLRSLVSLRRPAGSLRPVAVSAESQLVPVSTVTGQPPRPVAGHPGSRECCCTHLIPAQLVLRGCVESRLGHRRGGRGMNICRRKLEGQRSETSWRKDRRCRCRHLWLSRPGCRKERRSPFMIRI
jgi:hypothetical protein